MVSGSLFGDLDFSDRPLAENVQESRLAYRFKKNNYKFKGKILNDIEMIRKEIDELDPMEQLCLISNTFDSPNIINAYLGQLEEIYIATWAITPAGLACLANAIDKGCEKITVLMDRTHSYKWIFKDEAYKILKGFVRFKFSANHSKIILIKFNDGSVLNFVGSMNLSNNPRIENIRITKDPDEYSFYSEFINSLKATAQL